MTPRIPLPLAAAMAPFMLLAPIAAQAKESPASVSIAISAGSLGVGPEVGYRPVRLLGLRAGASFLGVSHDVDVDDINYRGDLKLRSYGANADIYPFRSAFRISAGFRVDRNRVDLVATPTQSVSIGQTTYTPAEIGTIEGKVKGDKVAPTLTVGLARNRPGRISWSLDAGAMFHGTPRTYDLTATGLLASDTAFQADLVAEKARIDDEVDKYKVYPVLQLSVGYAF